MNLGEGLRKLSISGGKHKDPVAEAARLGRSPTLKEVKQSVKVNGWKRKLTPTEP